MAGRLADKIRTDGMYYIQRDDRSEGYYIKDPAGNLIKKEYKVTFKDKLSNLFGGSEPRNPISTNFIVFSIEDGKLNAANHSYTGDAVNVAKQIKNYQISLSKGPVEEADNFILLDLNDYYLELSFDEAGDNKSSILKRKINQEIVSKSKYSFMPWKAV